MKPNQDVRVAAQKSGVKLWQVAEAYGLNDGNFSRRLRRELPTAEKAAIFAIIARLETVNKGGVSDVKETA